MTGVAAGLALCGKVVFTYSIANFPVMRCLEQIRNDVCYHNLDVKIVAVGGGLVYGTQGYTHHGVEDLAMMRVSPNMTVIAPGDPTESRLATGAIVERSGPCYLRLAKGGEPMYWTPKTGPKFEIGKAITVREGEDVTMLSTGGVLEMVLKASTKLASEGCSAQVLSIPTLQPLDKTAIHQAAQLTGKLITVEEHGIGGLGSAVAEVLDDAGQPARHISMRLRAEAIATVGSQATVCARVVCGWDH